MRDAETGQRGFVVTGDEDYLEPYTRGLREAAKNWPIPAPLACANPRMEPPSPVSN